MNLSKTEQFTEKVWSHHNRLYRWAAIERLTRSASWKANGVIITLENLKRNIQLELSNLKDMMKYFLEYLDTGEGDLHLEILGCLEKLDDYWPKMEDKEKVDILRTIFEENLPLFLLNRAKFAIWKAEAEMHPDYKHPNSTLVSAANEAFMDAKICPENSDKFSELQARLEILLWEVTPQKIAIYNLEMLLSRFEWSIDHPNDLIRPGMMPGEFNMEYQLTQVIREARKYPENEGTILALASRTEAVFEYQKQSRNK